MKKIKSLIDYLNERLFSSTYQVKRLLIITTVLLGIALVSFAIYYYHDRYSTSQPTTQQVNLAAAEQAVRSDPENTDKRLQLAQTYMIYRRFPEAVNQAKQVQQVAPDNVGADFVLGIAYANSDQPQQAVEPLQKFIDSRKDEQMPALDAQLQAALYYLGDSHLQLGQPDQAIAPLEKTVSEVGTDADSIYKLGLAYAGVKRYDDALKAFYVATAFVPNYVEVYQAMGKVYQAQNKTVEANYATAMVAYSKKDYATAYSMLATVDQAEPSFAPGFTGMGLTCEAQGNLQCALNSYQVATKLDPNDLTANQGVQRVQSAMQK
jgi:tetratricopeptide (TPR) repeat protein